MQIEEEIEIAQPRLSLHLRDTPLPGYICLGVAVIAEIHDKAIIFDEKYIPPILLCSTNSSVLGFINRIIGWMENKLEELARYAVDPSAGGGLQSTDYFLLQLLNRLLPLFQHLQQSRYVHPERLYCVLLQFAGELATFSSATRRANIYPAYDHDKLNETFAPIIYDIQSFLSIKSGRRAIRLELIKRVR